MKRKNIILVAAGTLLLTSCGPMTQTGATNGTTDAANVLGGVLGAITNGDALGNILGSVLGTDKLTEATLYGSWKYSQPGVAFTSDQLLAKAGGEVAASQVKEKLKSYYNSFGINSSTTNLTLKEDKTFSGIIAGKNISGTYTFDQAQGLLTLKTLFFTLPAYVKGSTTGMSLLFESKKLLTFLQTAAIMSGNSELKTIGDLSKNYDGVRTGFDMSR